jgi:hypothetical protein
MNRTMSSFAMLAGIAGAYLLSLGRAHLAEVDAQRAASLGAYQRFERSEAEAAREAELLDSLQILEGWRDELRPTLTLAGEATSFLLAITSQLRSDGVVVERSEAMSPDSRLPRPHAACRSPSAAPWPACSTRCATSRTRRSRRASPT